MRMLRVNQFGVMLVERANGELSITQENPGPGANTVYHCGQRAYVKRQWNTRYAFTYTPAWPNSGVMMRGTKPEKSLLFRG